MDSVGGLTIDNIIANNELFLRPTKRSEDDIERYLKLKHFSAIQAVLNVYLGQSPGGVDDSCTIAGVEFNGEHTIIDAEIKINLMADRVKACDHCGPN